MEAKQQGATCQDDSKIMEVPEGEDGGSVARVKVMN